VIYGVILAGGRGERFWPLSRISRPKQFLRLASGKMMLEETIDRILPLIPMENIRIVTGQDMAPMVLDQINSVTDDNILTEPVGRNTAPAIGLAAAHLVKDDPDAIMVVLSADHLIRPAEKLLNILEAGSSIAAAEDSLLTIGIVPTRPETGYGYIKLGELYKQEADNLVHYVSGFTEKPRAAVALDYYYSNTYLWNSGMFIWSAKSILDAIRKCQPDLGTMLDTYAESIGTPNMMEARKKFYEEINGISIDFAVLEKAENVLTIKADIVWDDVGDWRSLERYQKLDKDKNVVLGDAVTLETYETTIVNESKGLVACLGVSDLIVVQANGITMVAHRTRAQDIKKLLAKLAEDEEHAKYL